MQVTYMDDVIGAEQSTRAHQAQASGESRAATIERLLKGAIDLHCHSGPSVMPRDLDHIEAIKEASDAGLRAILRAEEHTSELQSLMRISYAVFCLKKKKTQKDK